MVSCTFVILHIVILPFDVQTLNYRNDLRPKMRTHVLALQPTRKGEDSIS